jgi:hypothetical protein
MGGARMELLTIENTTLIASMTGSLRCKKGGAKRSDNPIAAFVGSMVLLQTEAYGVQIVGILNRAQRKAMESHFPSAPKGFFAEGTDLDGEEDGFDWDEPAEEDIDVDAI